MAADRQVVERDKDGEPVRRAMGDGQGLGEELRSRLVVPLSEPDLAEEVVTPGQPSAIAGRGELVRIQLPDQVLALVEQVAGASVLVMEGQQVAKDAGGQGGAQFIPRLAEQGHALLEQRLGACTRCRPRP